MVLGRKALVSGAVILVWCTLVAQGSYTGGVLPVELLRPVYGEEPRFPRDYIIGELGQGAASEESYRYARILTANLAEGRGAPEGLFLSEVKRGAVMERLNALGVRRGRVGGGRNEPDGAVSFLVRFLGREQSITGELYLRQAEPVSQAGGADAAGDERTAADAAVNEDAPSWLVDDLLLEQARGLAEGQYSPSGADMTAYERFF